MTPRDDDALALREAMVRTVARDVSAASVLEALREIPRHLFMPGASLERAYHDSPAAIGYGQTISQPTIVGIMTEALDLSGNERVLEIGTGSGYQAAVLSLLAREVFSIEVVAPLADEARERLVRLGYTNVHVRSGDGYLGWPEAAPFDRIVLTAAPETVPSELLSELGDGGVLVAPVGADGTDQRLVRIVRQGDTFLRDDLMGVRFVPMVALGEAREADG